MDISKWPSLIKNYAYLPNTSDKAVQISLTALVGTVTLGIFTIIAISHIQPELLDVEIDFPFDWEISDVDAQYAFYGLAAFGTGLFLVSAFPFICKQQKEEHHS
jgi:hypothetical protein